MSSQRSNGHDLEPDRCESYPRPPEVEHVEARGPSFDEPRAIDVEISFWPRGEDCGRHYAVVAFRCRGMRAELWDIDSDGDRALAEQLGAAVVAEEVVLGHPSVKTVTGVEDHVADERDWICDCHEAGGST